MKSFLLAGVALLLAAPASAFASASVPTTELNPGSLPRGEDVAIAHMEGQVVVDGDTRIRVHGARVELLGTSGSAYVVHVSAEDGYSKGRTLRVEADGSTLVLSRHDATADLRLADDGDHLVRARTLPHERTAVRVIDARTAEVVASRVFHSWVFTLDATAGRVVLSSWTPVARTVRWDFGSDTVRVIVHRTGGVADIGTDRLGSYTGDPYAGGCYVVSSLRHPADVLWRTCGERAVAFSPDGLRVATVGILDDGLGPSQVTVRRVSKGAVLARYAARWFGEVRWESDTALLLDANGERKSATVRCVLTDCERASDLQPAPQY